MDTTRTSPQPSAHHAGPALPPPPPPWWTGGQAGPTGHRPGPTPPVPPAGPPRPPSAVSPTAEALGYTGGVLTTLAAVYLVGDWWAHLGSVGQVALLALAAVGLGTAAAVVGSDDPVARRLSTTLWFLTGITTTVTSYLLVEGVADLGADAGLLTAGLTAAAASGAAWRRTGRAVFGGLCYLGTLTALLGGVGVAGGDEALRALAVWALGTVWMAAGVLGVLRPARSTVALGALTALAAAQTVIVDAPDQGLVLGLVVTASLVAAAWVTAQRFVWGWAALSAFVVVPQAIARWLPEEITGTVVILLVGLTLLGACITLVLRSRRDPA